MFHLTTTDVWEPQANSATYRPEPFAREGFIHCTNGEQNVIDTGNRYYTSDPRTFVCLEIDPNLVESDIRYADSGRIYPHVHGPLNINAVVAVRPIERDAAGTFLSLGNAH